MSDDICCICLSGFKNKSVKYYIDIRTFSMLHGISYIKNLFIECPLCRLLIKIPFTT